MEYTREYFLKKNLERLDSIEQNIPNEMKEQKQWCPYKTYYDKNKGHKKKFILNHSTGEWASSTDSRTWTDFNTALECARKNKMEGIAFAIQDSGLCFIDLDDCLDRGKPNEIAKQVLALIGKNTYAEKSVSGNGLHIIARKPMGMEEYTNRVTENGCEIEYYDYARFASMTGNVLFGNNHIGELSEEMVAFLKSKLKKKIPEIKKPVSELIESDREVVQRIQRSKKASDFEQLMQGVDLKNDHSRSDMQLLNILAFFSNCNVEQMISIFRTSGLYRPEKENYLRQSAEKACDCLVKTPNFHGGRNSAGKGK